MPLKLSIYTTDIIFEHLDKEPRREIKYRPDVRYNPEKIFDCLREVFGDRDSITALQKKFFDRKQRKHETIRQYSHGLLELFDHVIRKEPEAFQHQARTLSEQFAHNLNDPLIRRDVKKMVRDDPTIDFLR